MDDQEAYLQKTGLLEVVKRGITKLVTEFSSVKFLLLIFVCLGVWFKVIGDALGLGTALILVGIREVPVDQIVNKITGRIG